MINGSFIFDNLKNDKISDGLKIWAIMNLLHDEKIGIHKAGEMCKDAGIFSSWCAIEGELYDAINNEIIEIPEYVSEETHFYSDGTVVTDKNNIKL